MDNIEKSIFLVVGLSLGLLAVNVFKAITTDCEQYTYHETRVGFPIQETHCIKYTDDGILRTPISELE